jgi:hypothetical protein
MEMKNQDWWDATQCQKVNSYDVSGRTCCLYLQGLRVQIECLYTKMYMKSCYVLSKGKYLRRFGRACCLYLQCLRVQIECLYTKMYLKSCYVLSKGKYLRRFGKSVLPLSSGSEIPNTVSTHDDVHEVMLRLVER